MVVTYDPNTNRVLGSFPAHAVEVVACRYLPATQLLLTLASDGVAKVWDCDPDVAPWNFQAASRQTPLAPVALFVDQEAAATSADVALIPRCLLPELPASPLARHASPGSAWHPIQSQPSGPVGSRPVPEGDQQLQSKLSSRTSSRLSSLGGEVVPIAAVANEAGRVTVFDASTGALIWSSR